MKVCCNPVGALGSRDREVVLCCPLTCDVEIARTTEGKWSCMVVAGLESVLEELLEFSQWNLVGFCRLKLDPNVSGVES